MIEVARLLRVRLLGGLGLIFISFLGAGIPVGAEPERAYVKVALEPVYHSPNPSSEQVTQAFLWEPVQVLEQKGSWTRVLVLDQFRTPEGYPGWIRTKSLADSRPPANQETWVTVAYPEIVLRAEPDLKGAEVLRVFLSTRLPVAAREQDGYLKPEVLEKDRQQWFKVRLPDRAQPAWVRRQQVAELGGAGGSSALHLLEKASTFEGVKYLWGGMSVRGIDCSGFVYTVFRLCGHTLPRDADQQFEVGTPVETEELRPGDLVFFGKPNDITHVGIYKGDGDFIHASSGGGVLVSPLFEGYYLNNYQGARRVLAEGFVLPGIWRPNEGYSQENTFLRPEGLPKERNTR